MKAEEQQLQPSKLYLLGSRSNPRHQWGVGKAETSQGSLLLQSLRVYFKIRVFNFGFGDFIVF
ncbi:hypothetical protein GYH30_035548 [Glycine max]|nr:hypothetical protein GYH30_035548 [Glycine max]